MPLLLLVSASLSGQLEITAPKYFNQLTYGPPLGEEGQFAGVGVTSASAGPIANPAYPEASGDGIVLRSARIGNSFVTGVPRYFLGDVITPPLTTADGVTTALPGYWRSEPVRPGEVLPGDTLPVIPGLGAGEYEKFYYSPHADRVFATQSGSVEIIWVAMDNATQMLTEVFNVSSATSGTLRNVFWTEKSFDGPRVNIPAGRIDRVNPVYNANFPATVSEEFKPLGYVEPPDPNSQPAEELRTLWFEKINGIGQLGAYNAEGRIFVEYLGSEISPGLHEFLGADVVEVIRAPKAEITTIELGKKVLPQNGDTLLIGSPLLNISSGNQQSAYATISLPDGTFAYYAERENLNPDSVVFYWLEDKDASIYISEESPGISILWPKSQNRYYFVWPTHVDDYALVLTNPDGSSIESGLQFDSDSQPEIVFQDDPAQLEAAIDSNSQRMTVDLSASTDGFNRSLLKFSSANDIWYQPVYTQVENREIALETVYSPATRNSIVTFESTAGFEANGTIISGDSLIWAEILEVVDGNKIIVGRNEQGGGLVPEGLYLFNVTLADSSILGSFTGVVKNTPTDEKISVGSTRGLLGGAVIRASDGFVIYDPDPRLFDSTVIESIVSDTEITLASGTPTGTVDATYRVVVDASPPVDAIAVIGKRIERPSEKYSIAGNISSGTGYQPEAYQDPYLVGVEVAETGSIIPVNAVPGNDTLNVRWFQRIDSPVNAFSSFYVPSKLGRYTIKWPDDLGTWDELPGLTEERELHTSTLLMDGTVIVAGGRSFGGEGIRGVELFNPETGTWSSIAPLQTGSWGHTSTLLSDGSVLIVGGNENLARSEIYDPRTGTWVVADSLTEGRGHHGAVLLDDGNVIVAGGLSFNGSGYDALSSAEIYNPETQTWTEVSPMNVARGRHTMSVLSNGTVMVTGGSVGTGGELPLNSAELYDPETDTWTVMTNPPSHARAGATATLLPDGRLLLVGGEGINTANSAEVYDPITDSWTDTDTLNSQRTYHTATLMPDGKVLISGGINTSSVEICDPNLGTWTEADGMSQVRASHTSTLLESGDVLVSGGNSPLPTSSTEILESVGQVVMASNEGTAKLSAAQAAGYLYFQNDSSEPGYNPNEEHGVKLNNRFYALRNDLNEYTGNSYTSEPYLLVAYTDFDDGRPAMKPFKVLREDTRHTFNYPWTAGTKIQGPMPLPLMSVPVRSDGTIANTEVEGTEDLPPDPTGTSPASYNGFTYEDRQGYKWVYRGPHGSGSPQFGMQWYYPMRSEFFIPGVETQPDEGTALPYLRPLDEVGAPQGDPVDGTSLTINYSPSWPDSTPSLRIAETLTLPKYGLPDVRNQASAEILYNQSIAKGGSDKASVILHDPTRYKTIGLLDAGLEKIPESIRTTVYQGKTYFQGLPPHLQQRFFYDPLASLNGSLIIAGKFHDEIAGEDYLDLNVLSPEDESALKDLAINEGEEVKTQWEEAINGLTARLETFIEDPEKRGTYIVTDDDSKTFEVGPYSLASMPDADTARDSYALTASGQGDGFVTLFFGGGKVPNLTPQGDPPVMQIIRVVPELYNGDLKVRLSSNPLDEKVSLRHSADFAANPDIYEFEWRHSPPTESGVQPPTYLYTAETYIGDPGDLATSSWRFFQNPESADPPSQSYSVDQVVLPQQVIINDFAHDPASGLPGVFLRTSDRVDFSTGIPAQLIFSANTGDLDGFVLYVNGAIALVHGNGIEALDDLVSESTYDLLLTRVNSIEDIPDEGQNLFSISEIEGQILHFRVFDAAGIQVVDLDESLLTSKSAELNDLRARLSTLWAITNLDTNDKISVISLAADIVEFDLDNDFSSNLSGTGLSKQFLVDGNYFLKGLNTVEVAMYSEADLGIASNLNFRLEGSSKLDRVDPLAFPASPWQLATGDPIAKNMTTVGGSPTSPLGSPLLVMSDNYFTMRYRAREFLADGETPNPAYTLTNGEWSDWVRPALVEGWIKRVLAAINPFNQRIKDLFNNAVNTDVSLLTQAGTKWEGDIALTLEAINDVGLIEIYETVLNRGKGISIESGYDYGPANDALLLAAGYLHDLYTILGNEAFADAANPTISIDDDDTVLEVNTSRFSFEGQVASVLDEELALLRGRDDFLAPQVTQSPFYNRLFWNYTRGINSGEALYAVNYNIKEKVGSSSEDGSIDAADAQRMFPQGHGDAYGHYLTALKGYYTLLTNPNFTWVPRTEALNILGNTVSVDYQDERKFAEAAANVSRTAEQVVNLTHRQQYNNDRSAGWQHFRDGKENPTTPPPNKRYWGLDEWNSRASQGAYYNWVVGNAMLPDVDDVNSGIQKIDRTTVPELELLSVIAESFQSTADNASDHLNPLGLSPGAIAFDIDPAKLREGESHYEQIYERALNAVLNAKGSFDQAAVMTRLLRNQENQIDDFNTSIEDEERAFNYKLIDLYGTPYPGDVGPGKTYSQGYAGPDIVNWFVIDRPSGILDISEPITIEARVPINITAFVDFEIEGVNELLDSVTAIGTRTITVAPFPFGQFSDLWAPGTDLGSRSVTGEVQQALNSVHLAYIAVAEAEASLTDDYKELVRRGDLLAEMLDYHQEVLDLQLFSKIKQVALSSAQAILLSIGDNLQTTAELTEKSAEAASEAPPKSAGFSNDVTSSIRSGIKAVAAKIKAVIMAKAKNAENEALRIDRRMSRDIYFLSLNVRELELAFEEKQAAYEYEVLLERIVDRYFGVASLTLELQQSVEHLRTVMAMGDRIQLEREIFRKRAATVVQGYRTNDLTFRVFRNEALEQYRTLFDLAARYTYLAANSYDYETGLLGTTEGQAVISKIVSSRALGDLTNDQPQATVSTLGDAGLAGTMAQLQADWSVAEGRLGINNPDANGTLFSLRQELFRIMDDPDSTDDDQAWQQVLEQHMVSDISADPDVSRYCLGVAKQDGSPAPGIIIEFTSTIEQGKNFFGLPLAGGDHTFSPSTFATKIYAASAVFEGYVGMDPYAEFIPIPNQPVITEPDSSDPNALSATPYMYLIPTGVDLMRAPPLGDTGNTRSWMVHDQALPLPYNLGANAFSTTEFFNANGTLTEQPWVLRKHQAFRAVDDPVFFYSGLRDEFQSSRLVGRSVWNTSWKIVIPAYALLGDEQEGLNRFAASVDDIKVFLRTYSHSGN